MASKASWRDRKSEWQSREGRLNLSHPSHSHLLLRAALVWLLATPPNGELVHRLLVLRRKPREMELSVFYYCICTFPCGCCSVNPSVYCLLSSPLYHEMLFTLTGPHNMLIDWAHKLSVWKSLGRENLILAYPVIFIKDFCMNNRV